VAWPVSLCTTQKSLCVPHKCHCGSSVDAQGLHGFVCKKASGRPVRRHALNDFWSPKLWSLLAFQSPKSSRSYPVRWEAARRPFPGLTDGGKAILLYDVTVVCPLADSCVVAAAREAGSPAEAASCSEVAEIHRDGDKSVNRHRVSVTD